MESPDVLLLGRAEPSLYDCHRPAAGPKQRNLAEPGRGYLQDLHLSRQRLPPGVAYAQTRNGRAPRLPGTRTRSVVASQATQRRDAAAVARHERHRVTVRRVRCGPDGEKPDRLCALQGRDERALLAAGFRAACIFRPASCSEFGLFRCEGNVRPRVHLYACNERVAAVLGAEDRCLTLSHIEPVLAQTIDDVWLMGDENGVGAGLR
jgi:hypothetical protein